MQGGRNARGPRQEGKAANGALRRQTPIGDCRMWITARASECTFIFPLFALERRKEGDSRVLGVAFSGYRLQDLRDDENKKLNYLVSEVNSIYHTEPQVLRN